MGVDGTLATSDGETIAYSLDTFADPWRETPPLLMLHSLMGHSRRFNGMAGPLAQQFDVLRMDMRGHGRSSVPAPDSPLSLERMTQDVVELLDHLGLERIHVVGNSAGGYLSQHLAITAPERVISLSLFGSTPGLARSGAAKWIPLIGEKGLRTFLAETISDRFQADREPPEKIEWFLDECAKNDTAFIVRCLQLFTSLDWSDQLHRISAPTMIVAAGGETVGAAGHYTEMRDRIPGAKLIYYQGLPHNICDIVPERCVADVKTFLRWTFPEFDHLL